MICLALLCMACSGHEAAIGTTDGESQTGGSFASGTGGDSVSSGGVTGSSGGSGGGSGGMSASSGGSTWESTGGALSSGGVTDAAGGAMGLGGAGEDGGTGGEDGHGGDSPSAGGSAVAETVIWSGAYSGDSVAMQGDSWFSARLYLDYPDCPVGSPGPIYPGDVFSVNVNAANLSCANPAKFPVARLGPMEWDMPALPTDVSSATNIRFELFEFTAAPWPATTGTSVYVAFSWSMLASR